MSKILTSFLNNQLESQFLQEFIFDIITNNSTLSILFLKLISSEDINLLITTILSQIEINNETFDIRLLLSSFLSESKNDLSEELAMKDFSTLNFFNSFNLNDEITDQKAKELSYRLKLLRGKNPGIFYTIHPKIINIIEKIGNDRIFNAIGPDLISLCINPPIEFFQQVNNFEDYDIQTYFQFPQNFEQIELTHLFQTKYISMNFYPKFSSKYENPKFFSILNSTLHQNSHFVDILYKTFEISIEEEEPGQIVKNFIDPILDFLPYMIISRPKLLLKEKYLEKFANIFDGKVKYCDTIERFKNDFKFLKFIISQSPRTNLNDRICYGNLFISSFPFLLENSLDKTELILKYSNTKFFFTFEATLENDFDFVRCYGAIHLLLTEIIKNHKKPSFNSLGKKLERIAELIKEINNLQLQVQIIIELFSCIFLQDSDDNFICHPFIAQQTIQLLKTFLSPSEVLRANSLFEKKRASKNDCSLEDWFDGDVRVIYNAIESKNWSLAEKLTTFLPNYSKLYSQSFQVFKYVNDNESPKIDNFVKLNILLSSKTQKKKLIEISKKVPKIDFLKPIIEYRLSHYVESYYLCSVFDDQDKWDPVKEFSIDFDRNFEESLTKIKRFPKEHIITAISHHLDNFLNYVYKYYRCSVLIDSVTFDSIQDLFEFNFLKAIEGSIMYDKMASANELTGVLNIDLTDYIFKNLNSFDINSTFISNLSAKYPFESTALAYSNSIDSDMNLPPNMQKIYEFLVNTKEQEKSHDVISFESILKLDSDEIEDVIFNVDHQWIYQKLMSRFDDEAISTNYYKMFSYVSYVSPKKDLYRIKSIEMMHLISQLSTKKKAIDIVNDLYGKEDQNFQILIDYLYYSVNNTELSNALIQLFTLSLNNEHQIDLILHQFPKYFDILMVRFYYIDGMLPHLINFAPSYKLQFLKSISFLPQQIISESNIFDVDSIIRSFINNSSSILKMPNDVSLFFTDDQLFAILKGTINSPYFNKIVCHFLAFFKDKNKLIDFWCDATDNKLKSFKINSIQKEDEIVHLFDHLNKIIDLFDHEKINQYRSLSKFISLRPFMKYNIEYSFKKFRKKSFLNEILSICNRIDHFELIFDLVDSFGFNYSEFYNRIQLQLVFGNYTNAIELIQKVDLKIDEYSKSRFYDRSLIFLCPLTKLPIIKCNEKNQVDVYRTVKSYTDLNLKGVKKSLHSSPEAIKALNFIISKCCNKGPSMSLFISLKEFDKAYDVINSIQSPEEKIELFINFICLPVIFNGFQTDFSHFILKRDADLTETKSLWDSAIDFFIKKNMPHFLIFAYQIENRLEEAAIVAFNSMKNCKSFFMENYMLHNIIVNLESSIKYRKSLMSLNKEEFNQNVNRTVIDDSKNFEEILDLLILSKIQLKASTFFDQQSIPFTHDFDIFESSDCAISASAFLFINNQFDLMEEIRNYKKLSKMDIYCRSCDFLAKSSPEKVNCFVKNLNENDRLDLLKALSLTNNRSIFLSIICGFYDAKQQELLFLDYNLVVESFAVAYEANDRQLIPLIAHKASILGDMRTVDECIMFLNDQS